MTQVIERVACIGSGVIGASWATNFLLKGHPVILHDINDEILLKAKEKIHNNLIFLKDKGIIDDESIDDIVRMSQFTTDISLAVKDVQLIQESGPENYAVKQKILKEVEKYADKKAVYATSASGLLISQIAKFAKYPERCLGAHPYNPPHLVPLVEMTGGEKTSEEALHSAYNFYKGIGKEPVILKKETLGFIANRLQTVLYREVIELVMRGVCTVEDIDKACLYGPGLRYGVLGPNLIFHLGGGEQGIKGMVEHLLGPSFELWLPDTAKWEKIPEAWGDTALKGVEEEMRKRSEEEGRTCEDIIRYRDDMLIKLLKLHRKI